MRSSFSFWSAISRTNSNWRIQPRYARCSATAGARTAGTSTGRANHNATATMPTEEFPIATASESRNSSRSTDVSRSPEIAEMMAEIVSRLDPANAAMPRNSAASPAAARNSPPPMP